MEALQQYTILYAEDESSIRTNMVALLGTYFKTVHVAHDGEEALELYHKVNADALLLDINMPKLNGLDVVRRIRETNRDVPIVILTAFTEAHLLLEAVELNLCKYLVKPLGKVKFKEALLEIKERLALLSEDNIFISEKCYWNKNEKKLYHDNESIVLSIREQILMELFMKKYSQNISIEEIMAYVWEDKYDKEISIDSVKKLVSTLRKKLPKECLKNVYGYGYVLTVLK